MRRIPRLLLLPFRNPLQNYSAIAEIFCSISLRFSERESSIILMTRYNGTYPHEGRPIRGYLNTFSIYPRRLNLRSAMFWFDEKELPGQVAIGVVSDRDELTSESEVLRLARDRGFKEGE